jgi:hypothetical protein
MPRLSLEAKPDVIAFPMIYLVGESIRKVIFPCGPVYTLLNVSPLHILSRLVDMIIIEKTDSMDFPFVLRVGDLQHPLIADELMQLRCCLENCRDENAPVPKSRCKLLPPWHSPPEEQERDVKRVRATLWVGEKRWRISKAEEESLLLDARRLMGEGNADNDG